MIQYDLTVCIGSKMQSKQPIIKCHDTGIKFAVQLVVCRQVSQWREEHDPYSFPDGASAVLRVRKPDHTKVVVDAEIVKGIVLCDMSKYAQAFTAAGECSAEISIYDADGNRLTSGTFQYIVDEECVCDCDSESENYVDAYAAILKTIGNLPDLKTTDKSSLVAAINEVLLNSGVTDEQVRAALEIYLEENPVQGVEAGENVSIVDGKINVLTTNATEQDNTRPITSAGVYATVGNIEALLKTI